MGSPGWHRGSEVTAPPSSSPFTSSLQQVFARGSAPPGVTSFREKDRQSLSSQAALSLFQKGRTPPTLPPTSQPEQGIRPCKDQPVAGRAETSRTGLDQSYASFRGWAGHCPACTPRPRRLPGDQELRVTIKEATQGIGFTL